MGIKNEVGIEGVLKFLYRFREMPQKPSMLKVIARVAQQTGPRSERRWESEDHCQYQANGKGHQVISERFDRALGLGRPQARELLFSGQRPAGFDRRLQEGP